MLKDFFGRVGETLFFVLIGVNSLFSLLVSVCRSIVASFYQRKLIKPRSVFQQVVLMGLDSLPIICLVGASVGMVLALQGSYQLKQIGGVLYTGRLVSVSMTRELGPLVAAIVIAGRVGARIAAELGTMKVSEEVDALSTMGLNPISYLVAPRTISLMIALPCLTVFAIAMGMLGGLLIGVFALGINGYLYWDSNFDALVVADLYGGLFKSFVFALLVALVSCHQGLSVEGGAEGVGKATTAAVVISVVLIIVADCITTAVICYVLPPAS